MHRWEEVKGTNGISFGPTGDKLILHTKDVDLFYHIESLLNSNYGSDSVDLGGGLEFPLHAQPGINGVTHLHIVHKYRAEFGIGEMYNTPSDIAKIKREIEDALNLFPKTKYRVVITEDGADLV
jgi:hypothetical protein